MSIKKGYNPLAAKLYGVPVMYPQVNVPSLGTVVGNINSTHSSSQPSLPPPVHWITLPSVRPFRFDEETYAYKLTDMELSVEQAEALVEEPFVCFDPKLNGAGRLLLYAAYAREALFMGSTAWATLDGVTEYHAQLLHNQHRAVEKQVMDYWYAATCADCQHEAGVHTDPDMATDIIALACFERGCGCPNFAWAPEQRPVVVVNLGSNPQPATVMSQSSFSEEEQALKEFHLEQKTTAEEYARKSPPRDDPDKAAELIAKHTSGDPLDAKWWPGRRHFMTVKEIKAYNGFQDGDIITVSDPTASKTHKPSGGKP